MPLDEKVGLPHTCGAMKQREYETLKAQIEAEYRKKSDALELVWKMSVKGAASAAPTTGRGAVLNAVKSAINVMHGNFNTADIERQIRGADAILGAKVKRGSISNTLKRLVGEKLIEVVDQGTGRQASTYKRVSGKVE